MARALYQSHLKFIRLDRGASQNERGLTRGQKLTNNCNLDCEMVFENLEQSGICILTFLAIFQIERAAHIKTGDL